MGTPERARAYIITLLLFMLALSIFTTFSVVKAQGSISLTLTIRTCSGSEKVYESGLYPKVYLRTCSEERCIVNESTCYNGVCKFEGLISGTYVVQVYWRGVLVYNGTVDLSKNETLEKTVDIYANVSPVRLLLVNDEGKKLPDFEIRVEGYIEGKSISCTFTSDSYEHLLPFGSYRLVSAKYRWKANGQRLIEEVVDLGLGSVRVSCEGYSLERRVSVASSVVLEFVRTEGGELKGENVTVKVYRSRDNALVAESVLKSDNVVKLSNIPYGKYLIRVYASEGLIHSQEIDVSGSGSFNIKVGLLKAVTLRIVDEQGKPLRGAPVFVTTPLGKRLLLETDSRGLVSLSEAPEGAYRVEYYWRAALLVEPVTVYVKGGGPVEVRVPVSSVDIVLTAYAGTLPSGVKARLILEGYGVVDEEATDREQPSLKLHVDEVPSSYPLRLVVEWGKRVIYDSLLNVGVRPLALGSTREIKLDLYTLSVKVSDVEGRPLPGAQVVVRGASGSALTLRTDAGGLAVAKHLFKDEYTVAVLWRGLVLTRARVGLEELRKGSLNLIAHVYDLKISLRGATGQPLSGFTAIARVKLPNGTVVAFRGSTSSDILVLPRIPMPPGSVCEVKVCYRGRACAVKQLVPGKRSSLIAELITLDVLLDLGGLPLSTAETMTMFVGMGGGAAAALFLYRRYKLRRDIEELLAPSVEFIPAGYDVLVEYERRSFLEKLKDYLEAVFGGKHRESEEEEEWELFGQD